MFNISNIILSNEIDTLDREILSLITKGNSSSYSVWSAMNKQMQGQGLAYVNIKKRISRMVTMDILQKIEPGIGMTNIRGRKEYKVTLKGLEHLIISIEDIKTVIDYIDRFHSKSDKHILGRLLTDKFVDITNLLNEYLKCVGHPELVPITEVKTKQLVTKLQELKMYPRKTVEVGLFESVLVSDSVARKATPGYAKDGLIPETVSKQRRLR